MNLITNNQQIFRQSGHFLAALVRILLNIVLIIVIVALGVGVFKAGHDLVTSLDKPLTNMLQGLLINIVFIIALVEITIIILSYLKDGRIILRYIVDAILIIMISEIISLWFRGPSLTQAGSIAIIIVTLLLVRLGVTYIESNSTRPA
jgi:uncharacterized membrane protein (DUF373 family)